MPGAGLASPFFFFTAFLLLLLVTLSVPIIKSIYLFDIVAAVSVGSGVISASVHDTVRFGIFGWCSSPVAAKILTVNLSDGAQCSKHHLGFTVSSQLESVLSSINEKDLVDVMQKALSVVLVLHPVACGITFLALVLSLLAVLLRHTRFWDFLAVATGSLASLLTTLVFIIDIIFVAIAKHKLHSETHGDATAGFGNAVWMTLVAAICTWIACVGACWGVVSGRRQRNEGKTSRY